MPPRARSGRRGVKPGAPPPEDVLDEPGDPESIARSICLRLLTGRARSRAELAAALRRKGIPDTVATGVLDRFSEVGLIDDAAFAEQMVHTQHSGRGLGRRALTAELRRRGIGEDEAADAVAVIDSEQEERRARALVATRLSRRRARSQPDTAAGTPADTAADIALARKLVGMLARKGYSPSLAYRVVRAELGELGHSDAGDRLD